jgi:6-pyruvoyltetrahydropterin/6-carboxytetrahydropterin synthase|tara:strand:+ start:976 stop:1389 length:414 start_codon:yes stop_codon:yes gene_type:complete
MIYLTKQYKFCAAHKYWNKDWSDQKNIEVFDEDVKVHGHNYTLSITVKGEINNDSGFIVDIKKLNKIISQYIINIFDHSQIEKDIDWFKNKQPSTENMLIFMWDEIVDRIPSGAILHCIKLRETPTIFSEYYGPERK